MNKKIIVFAVVLICLTFGSCASSNKQESVSREDYQQFLRQQEQQRRAQEQRIAAEREVQQREMQQQQAAQQQAAQAQAAQAAQQAAQAAQQEAERRAARTVTEDMFQVRQLANNTLEITRYTGDVENVVIPSRLYGLTVTVIGEYAFARTQIRSVVIPDTVIEIGQYAFSGDRGTGRLERVTIGRNVRTIGDYAFQSNSGLTEIIIPDSVTSIGESAFAGCGLTSITWGRGLLTIGERAFVSNRLTSVTLPAGLRSVGTGAFQRNQIHTVTIPSSQTLIGVDRQGRHWAAFDWETITRATLPANLNNNNLVSFEQSLRNFYISQNRAAGTYVKNGPIWTRQ